MMTYRPLLIWGGRGGSALLRTRVEIGRNERLEFTETCDGFDRHGGGVMRGGESIPTEILVLLRRSDW